MPVDQRKVGEQIARLRKERDLTQAELGERLCVSFQAVSKWERGETLPDTALLPDLARVLQTTVDMILSGGERIADFKGTLSVSDMFRGVDCLARLGELLGKQNILYLKTIEGLSEKINSDVQEMLDNPFLRECLVAEAILYNLRLGYYFDLSDIRHSFQHEKWVSLLTEHAAQYGIR